MTTIMATRALPANRRAPTHLLKNACSALSSMYSTMGGFDWSSASAVEDLMAVLTEP